MSYVLVVTTAEREDDALRGAVGPDDHVKVVVPALKQGLLDWLANDERAFSHAARVADDRAAELPADDVDTAAGEANIALAIRDALATFPADEVVVAVGPAFGRTLRETIGGIPHEEVLRQVCAGIEEEGVRYRVIRIGRTSDVAFIAHDGAQLAGSGVAIGLQSKGTAVIQRADLQPLDNLELFGMAPLLRPDSYRQIGRNAARYANGGRASPVPLVLDNFARAKLIVRTALLHRRETEAIEPGAPAVDVTLS